jgi:DNA-binding IclR family transcriptional regulator
MSSVSQSVGRSLAVFELFSERKCGLTAVEIAQSLEAPRSSVAAILKELTGLSMISLNRQTLTYLPTLKFAELGCWLTDPGHFPVLLASQMEALQVHSGETITASWPIEHEMEIIQVASSRRPISFVAERGQRLPLWSSSGGMAFLSSMTNTQVRARWERHRRLHQDIPTWEVIQTLLSETRAVGVAVAHGSVFDDASALSVLTGFELDGRPLVCSLAGPKNRIMEQQFKFMPLLLGLCRRTLIERESE